MRPLPARLGDPLYDTVIPALPFQPTKIIVDVSGDGIDNCTDPDEVDAKRDAIANAGVRINGLPIIVKGWNYGDRHYGVGITVGITGQLR